MKHRYLVPILGAALLLTLAACNNNNSTPVFTGFYRLANGITDSTANGGLKGDIANIPTVGPINFGQASGNNVVPEGSYKSQLTTGNGSGGTTTFTVNNVSVQHNHVITVFGYGTIAGNTLNGFAADEPINGPTNGQAVVQVLHAAHQASLTNSTLNFHVVTPAACTTTGSPSAAAFATSTSNAPYAGAKYAIIVKDASDAVVLFCSGLGGIDLPYSDGSNVFQIAAVDSPSGEGNGSSIEVLLLDNNGGTKQLVNLKN
jgi:hypothetical protein